MSLFYSIVPLELVFEGHQEDPVPDTQEIPFQGGILVVKPEENNQAKVVRVISSDPHLFLNPSLQPGSTVHFSLTPAGET